MIFVIALPCLAWRAMPRPKGTGLRGMLAEF